MRFKLSFPQTASFPACLSPRLKSSVICTALFFLMTYIQWPILFSLWYIIPSHVFFPPSTLIQVLMSLWVKNYVDLTIVLSLWASPLSICSANYCQSHCPKKCLDHGMCHSLFKNFQGYHIVYKILNYLDLKKRKKETKHKTSCTTRFQTSFPALFSFGSLPSLWPD